jgi:hypothetical protein
MEGTNGVDGHSGKSGSDIGADQLGEYRAGFGEVDGRTIATV